MIERALVIGGGVGGMTAALALTRVGVKVDLIDADPDWRVYGAGISVTGISLRAFEDIGILDDVRERGYVSAGMKVMNTDGSPIMRTPVPENPTVVESGGGIMRPVLHDILSKRVRAAGIDVTLGVRVKDLTQDADGVDIEFSDGRTSRYGLVVGADGIYSATRAMLFPDAAKPKFSGQGAWRVVAKRPAQVDRLEIYVGQHKLGLNPVSQTHMYMFLLQNLPDNPHITEEQYIPRLNALLEAYGGNIGTLRDELGAESLINYRPLEWVLLPDPWYKGRVVLIGDAAHATTPHLASGAGIAAEDGLVLAEEISRTDDVSAALAAFMKRRFERAKMVVERSVHIGELELAGEVGPSNMMLASGMQDLQAPY